MPSVWNQRGLYGGNNVVLMSFGTPIWTAKPWMNALSFMSPGLFSDMQLLGILLSLPRYHLGCVRRDGVQEYLIPTDMCNAILEPCR